MTTEKQDAAVWEDYETTRCQRRIVRSQPIAWIIKSAICAPAAACYGLAVDHWLHWSPWWLYALVFLAGALIDWRRVWRWLRGWL